LRDRRWIGVTVAACLTSALLGACGDSDPPSSTSSAATAPTTTAEQPPERPPTGDGEGDITLAELGSFEGPVYVTQPSSDPGHLYVVEQCGRVQRIPSNGGEPELFLDVSELIVCGGEQGLLSIAFDPAYRRSGLLYAYYTAADGTARIAEYRRASGDPSSVDPASARELLAIEDFAPNHNGGLLVFGPDGELYAGTGDGGGAGDPERTAQDLSSLLGKLLRVDRGEPAGEPEIAAYGLRNPWRFSFDRASGDLWIGDVGQSEREEIDSVPAAELSGELNFGWSAFEGSEPFNSDQEAPGALTPTLEYGRDGGCSVTGGYVVRDDQLESLLGRYLFGDYCQGELRSFTADPSRQATDERLLGLQVAQLSSFGEDIAGHVYALSSDGPVYRLVADGG
jgi:glucose/arabinose dehydrogenase